MVERTRTWEDINIYCLGGRYYVLKGLYLMLLLGDGEDIRNSFGNGLMYSLTSL